MVHSEVSDKYNVRLPRFFCSDNFVQMICLILILVLHLISWSQ